MQKLIYILLVVLLIACDNNGAQLDNEFDNESVEKATYTIIHSNEYTETGLYTEKTSKTYTTEITYATDLQIYTYDIPKEIDFEKSQVLLLDMGEQPSSGYSVEILGVLETESAVTVNVLYTNPDILNSNCIVTQALTNPFLFAEISTTKPLLIIENTISKSPCGE